MRQLNLLVACLTLLACVSCHGGPALEPAPAHGTDHSGNGTLTASVSFSGLELQHLASAPVAGQTYALHAVSLKQGHRLIDPGDIPDNLWLGQPVPLASGQWQLNQLPANQHVLLEITFAPSVDLATGLPAASSSGYRATVYLPVFVPADSTPVLSIGLNFTANPAGGYFVESRLRRTDKAVPEVLARLDYHAGQVARDSDADGDYADESFLPDPRHLGISAPLLARLDAENVAATSVPVLFSAALDAVGAAPGTLLVHNLRQLGQPGSVDSSALPVRFAEDSAFVSRQVSLQQEVANSQPPHQLAAGSTLTLLGRLLPTGAGGSNELWLTRADRLTLDLPPDTIAAVPLKQAARPGEPVPVTVYVNRTAAALHAVQRLRISFEQGNRYLPGSLDPGDRGGGAQLADGAWADSTAQGFALPDQDKLTSGAIGDTRAFVELSLAPQTSTELLQATGALCNFALVCNDNAALGVERTASDGSATYYTGLNGVHQQWAHCALAGQTQVHVSGPPVVLGIANPPAAGTGRGSTPYLVHAGDELNFTLSDPAVGDVTTDPLTEFTIRLSGAPASKLVAGHYTVPAGYTGPLQVSASYNGIYCQPQSEILLFVDSLEQFNLVVDDVETYIYGGAVERWTLQPVVYPERDYLSVNLTAHGARNLHALFCKIHYDPQRYALLEYVIPPAVMFGKLPTPGSSLEAGTPPGTVQFCLCDVHPEASPGTNGDVSLVEFRFQRRSVDSLQFFGGELGPSVPTEPSAIATLAPAVGALDWQPFIAGDYNQDGQVGIGTGNLAPIGDWAQLCINFNLPAATLDSPADVIDRRWDPAAQSFSGDGQTNVSDIVGIMINLGHTVDAWHVYYAPELSAYPAGGTLQAVVPYRSYNGSALQRRVSYRWQPAQGLRPGCYWVTPALGSTEGAASAAVSLALP